MGVAIEGLEDHEGYAARRLPDGILTGTWTWATREFDAYVAACGCGWRGAGVHQPTEAGEGLDFDQWDTERATPPLEHRAQQRRADLIRVLRLLGESAEQPQNPSQLARIGRVAHRVRVLVDGLQCDQERRTTEREASGER